MSTTIAQGSDDATPSPRRSKKTINLDWDTLQAMTQATVSHLQNRITVDTIRPLPMFLGISGNSLCFSPEAFAPPTKKLLDKSSPEKVKSRLRLNFSFFLSNYAMVVGGVALVTALMHPGMLVSIAMLWALWSFHTFLISNEVVVYGRNIGTLVSINHRSTILTGITILVVILKCWKPTIEVIVVSGILVLAHALMRDPKHMETASSGRRAGGRRDSSDDEPSSSDSEVMVERPMVRSDVA